MIKLHLKLKYCLFVTAFSANLVDNARALLPLERIEQDPNMLNTSEGKDTKVSVY